MSVDAVEMAAAVGLARSGCRPDGQRQAQVMAAVAGNVRLRTVRPARWTAQEHAFLRRHTGVLSDAEIARRLGRTRVAVQIRRKRRRFAGPTQCGDLTARRVGRVLGVDSKLVTRWIQDGTLKGRLLPIERRRWAVEYKDLKRFAVNPQNWVYFDTSRVTDPHLARLIALRRERWGDEWWTTEQVRAYWGARHNLVAKWIQRGRIRAVQPYGTNNNYYIRRSDAITYKFLHTNGRGAQSFDWSARGDAFMVLATAAGVPIVAVAGMYGQPEARVYARLETLLHDPGRVEALIACYDLPVQYDAGRRIVFADWRDPVCRQRLPQMAVALNKFLAGKSVNSRQLSLARGAMSAWARWQGSDDPALYDMAARLRYGSQAAPETVAAWCRQLQAGGHFPMEG